ncbi:MAG TPA: UDP-glucose--hexose-1-phosphate uridylyltransferase [Bacteroidota bacterium]|nr:UDP-glucose--hexose-1-phosphate uridylyltransferase [Bacteroidota bacterium]
MGSFNFQKQSHRRLNLLTGEWILVSPNRLDRPWEGKVETAQSALPPRYDPDCFLCPGNKRANGAANPRYGTTFVFSNDFSALTRGGRAPRRSRGLLHAEPESGECRVVCFSPRHDLTLARMESSAIEKVVETWTEEYRKFARNRTIHYVQIFENKGELMGCSNPHPHGQIWAQRSIPTEAARELGEMKGYKKSHRSCLLCDYAKVELQRRERVILANERFIALVPFWATWPFEALILPREHFSSLLDFSEDDRRAFAAILKNLTAGYDRLFDVSFPYSAGIHQIPTDGVLRPEFHLHMHFYPPLLRSATIKKFLVGYEMLAAPQRDMTPESAAKRLSAVVAV